MSVKDKHKVTFQDVAGVDEARQALTDVLAFLKRPQKFLALGVRLPKGVLLYGPPGTGKTLLARALANEANRPFFPMSGAAFVELYVGVGAARVRDLFRQARRAAPSIVFIDELDAVGRQRGGAPGGGQDEREQTLNQLLVEMDGFDVAHGVVVVAATNRPDILDPALLRSGRFDYRIALAPPDATGRLAIFQVHSRGKPLDRDVDLAALAELTPGFTGADISNMVNQAALLAVQAGRDRITMADMTAALETVLVGVGHASRVLDERERRLVAYHEAGHALVSACLPEAGRVYKISIKQGLQAGGHTFFLSSGESVFYTYGELLARLQILLAGRAAEILALGEASTAAEQDLQQATVLARRMVCRYGMSEAVGLAVLDEDSTDALDRQGRRVLAGAELACTVDREVNRLLAEMAARAMDLLRRQTDKLQHLAALLLERETVTGAELRQLCRRG